ncbi:6-bladed beta-propeller [Puteibacter caeruleilacunae]|nr:6-bladed beta-propeller [Puteibacter caeruleilacunae]
MKSIFGIMSLCILILLGCNNKKDQQIKSIKIDCQKHESFVYSDLFENPEFIPLETTKESIIGGINRIQVSKDYIIILDRDISSSLFVFSRQGKFIRKISSQGKGPGEYISITDFQYHEEEDRMYIYDGEAETVKIFKVDGSFVENVKAGVFASSFRVLDRNRFLFCAFINYSFYITEGKERVLSYREKQDGENSFYFAPSSYMISQNCNEVLACATFSPYIYEVNDNRITPMYYFDFGEYCLPNDFFEKYRKENWKHQVRKKNYCYAFNGLTHNKRYLMFEVFQGRGGCSIFYDRVKGEAYSFNKFKDDLTYIYPRMNMLLGDDKMLCFVEPYKLKNYKKTIKIMGADPDPAIQHQLQDLSERFGESDNPILVIYDLK